MKIAYLDTISGISGDMTLGALVDAGANLETIQAGIDSLGLPDCRLEKEEVKKKGFRATKIHVRHQPEHAHRHLHHITEMIDAAQLNQSQKDLAKRIFTRLGEAEAKVHGTTIQKVHFHEVGAVDSIADIVGTAIGWDLLGIQRLVCSPIPTGCGTITIAHGRVSIPAPATAELLLGIPIAPCDIEAELTTPTGAAIVSTLADSFGSMPAMSIETIGYGAGDRDLEEQGNVLRLMLGQSDENNVSDTVTILETNLDDISGELVGHCTERLLEAGAFDVYTTAIQMKKNRPGIKLSVLCAKSEIGIIEDILFRQTSTLGVRRWQADRHLLDRRTVSVETPWGTVTGKVAQLDGCDRSFSPEYESCRLVAEAKHIPLKDVYGAAQQAYRNLPFDT